MILGFGKKKDDEYEDEVEEEIEYVLFQGALNGKEANLASNARLAEAGLVPVKELITDALLRRAETVRLEPKGKGAVMNYSVDGVWYRGGPMMRQQALAVTQMTKLLAGLDTKERRKSQSGGMKAELQGVPYKLLVESTPVGQGGERLVVRVVNLNASLETPDDIGFSEDLKEKIRKIASSKSGVLVVCGPPRSGTTTTMLGVVRSIDAYQYTIYSIADLGGHEVNYVTPFEVNPQDDLETTIGRVMRVEADVLYVDPLSTPEITGTIFSLQHKLAFLAEIAAKDGASAILQLIDWLGDPERVARELKAVVSHKLIRLLCEKCKEAYRPNPKMVAKIGLPPETKVLYRPPTMPPDDIPEEELPEPCAHCGEIGYRGRTGLFGFIEMTERMREVVASGASAEQIKAQVRKEKMQSLQSEGLRLVAEGKTSLEELQRVFKAK